jgi:hypothetical protein
MIPQTILPYYLEEEKKSINLTKFASIPIFLELCHSCGLFSSIKENLCVQSEQSDWKDEDLVFAIILLNLTGADSVEDIDSLKEDKGLCELFSSFFASYSTEGKNQKKNAKSKNSPLPSKSSIFRFLNKFHFKEEESKRVKRTAFIPSSNNHLVNLMKLNSELCKFAYNQNPKKEITLDMDATLIETQKSSSLYSYKGFSAYQPFNVWFTDLNMMLYSEFRDGNVPAGFEQLRIFQESLKLLPKEVKKVTLRSDTAAYQKDLIIFCEDKKNHKEVDIDYIIGVSISQSLKDEIKKVGKEDWSLFDEEEKNKLVKFRKYCEVGYVPDWVVERPKEEKYRFITIREPIGQPELPNLPDPKYPFPTVVLENNQRYKIYVIITNKEGSAEDIINEYYGRSGASEHIHSELKSDLCGGKLPSKDFGSNAAWWQIAIISSNLISIMKNLVLGGEYKTKKVKSLRFHFICVAAKVLKRARSYILKFVNNSSAFNLCALARSRIWELRQVAS